MVAFKALETEKQRGVVKTIAVIAANGRTGKVFVEAALKAGYIVRAGIVGEAGFPPHKNLQVVGCNALDIDDVKKLLTGSDVAVSLIGHGKNSPARLQTDAVTNIIKAMNMIGIKRLISLTGTGVRFGNDTPSLADRLANIAIGVIDSARVKDGILHAEVLKDSQLDWTIVRVLKLTNGKHEGKVKFSLNGPAEYLTPRRRVAAAILQLIREDGYIRQAPIITGNTQA